MIVCQADEREKLVLQYAYLCARGARKFLRPGLERADLQQIAAIGLLKACDRYDPVTGTPFEAFAWVFVVGELMHFVRDHERIVRAPRNLRTLEQQVHRAADDLIARNNAEPTIAQIALHMGVASAQVEEALVYRERGVVHSLDSTLCRTQAYASNDYADVENALVLDAAMADLTDVERGIIIALYRADLSHAEVAKRFGFSRRHISRLHRNALQKMERRLVAGC